MPHFVLHFVPNDNNLKLYYLIKHTKTKPNNYLTYCVLNEWMKFGTIFFSFSFKWMNVLAIDWPICWNDCVDFVYGAENFQWISTGMAIAKLVLISQFWLRLIDDMAFSEVWTSPNCQRTSGLIRLKCGACAFVFFFFWNLGSTQVLQVCGLIRNRLFQIRFFFSQTSTKKIPKIMKKSPIFHLELIFHQIWQKLYPD